jgi:hypothetical protein
MRGLVDETAIDRPVALIDTLVGHRLGDDLDRGRRPARDQRSVHDIRDAYLGEARG